MCQKMGLLAPVSVDPLSTIPPQYELSQYRDVPTRVSSDDSVSVTSSIDYPLRSALITSDDYANWESEIRCVNIDASESSPTINTTSPAHDPSIEALTYSLGHASIMDDYNGEHRIARLLHGMARNFYYIPGQVFNNE
jgi:hypothetical protein